MKFFALILMTSMFISNFAMASCELEGAFVEASRFVKENFDMEADITAVKVETNATTQKKTFFLTHNMVQNEIPYNVTLTVYDLAGMCKAVATITSN